MEPAGGGFRDMTGMAGGKAESPWRDIAVDAEDAVVGIQENDINGKTHEEGVDAAAVREEHHRPFWKRPPTEQPLQALIECRGDKNINFST